MKGRKKLVLVALSVSVVFSFGLIQPVGVLAKGTKGTEITMWHWETPAHRVKVIDELAAECEKATGVKLKQVPIPFPKYFTKIMTALAAGELPDMIHINPPQLPILLDNDALVPTNEIFKELHAKYTFPETLYQVYRVNGQQYGIPIFGVGWPLTYREDLYKKAGLEPPDFWDELLVAAEKLHNPPEIYGYGLAASTKGNYGSQTVWGYMSTNRARIVGFEDGKEKIVFNSPETIETYKFLKKLSKYTIPGTASLDWAMSELYLRQGKFATMMYCSAFIRKLNEQNPGLAEKYAAKTLPRPRDGIIAHTGYPRAIVVTTAAKKEGHMEAVKDYLRWQYEPRHHAKLLRMEDAFFLPVTEATRNSEYFRQSPLNKKYWDLMPPQIKALNTAKFIGFPPGGMSRHAGEIESSFTLGGVLEKIVVDEWSVEKAVEWGQKQFEDIIAE